MWVQKIGAVCMSLLMLGVQAFPVFAQEATAPETYSDGMFTYAYVDGGVALYSVQNTAMSVKIPDDTDGRKIVEISDGAFYGCSSLESVTIGGNVRSIGKSAFAGCSALKQITIPDNVETIGENAFSGCTSLSTLELPDSLTEIPDGMCYFCALLENINYPASLEKIGAEAFFNCYVLPSPELPEGLKTIGNYAFASCGNITDANLPSTLESLGSAVYFGCTGLTEFTIPARTLDLGSLVFMGCTGITEFQVETGNSVYTASDGIIYKDDGATLLTYPAGRKDESFTIPEGVTTVYDASFFRTESLKNINFPSTLKYVGAGAFEYCSGLTTIVLPEGTEIIYENAFADCTSLSSVQFPDTLKGIGSYAFYACPSLKEVTIPANCKTIGEYAFGYTDGIEKDTNGNSVPVKIEGFKQNMGAVKLSTILLILAGICFLYVIVMFLVKVIRKNQITPEESEKIHESEEKDEIYQSITEDSEDNT